MKFSFLNPFNQIVETKFSPHARTLRTGFARKCRDAFVVFWGKPTSWGERTPKDPRAGLFDYATLMIPYLIYRINHWSQVRANISYRHRNRNPAVIPVFFVTAILTALLLIPRFIFAMALTVVFSPIIALVQLISSVVGRQLKKDVGKLPVTPPGKLDSTPWIGKLLKKNKCTKVINSDYFNAVKQTFTLYFFMKPKDKKLTPFQVSVDIDLKIQQHKTALVSLLRLNMGGITRGCEKSGRNLTEYSKTHLTRSIP